MNLCRRECEPERPRVCKPHQSPANTQCTVRTAPSQPGLQSVHSLRPAANPAPGIHPARQTAAHNLPPGPVQRDQFALTRNQQATTEIWSEFRESYNAANLGDAGWHLVPPMPLAWD